MKDRIFRFGVSGIVFLLSIYIGFWLLGGNYTNILANNKLLKENIILSALITAVSTPALGFIISSFSKEFWEYIYPRKKIFNLPRVKDVSFASQKYLQIIKKHFPENSGIEELDEILKANDEHTIFLNQQILLRTSEKNAEVLAFAARRMDVFYAHITGIFSIMSGLIIGFFVYVIIFQWKFGVISYKFLCLIPIILYFWIGFRQATRALVEANEFEKKFLLYSFSEKK